MSPNCKLGIEFSNLHLTSKVGQTNVFKHGSRTKNSIRHCYLIMFYYILKIWFCTSVRMQEEPNSQASLLTERDKQDHQYQNSILR